MHSLSKLYSQFANGIYRFKLLVKSSINDAFVFLLLDCGVEHHLRTVPTNTEVFCAVYDYAGKADLSKGY